MRQIRSTLIINLIDDSRKAEDAKWYLQHYYAAYPPLMLTDIPLIRETTDDLIDFEIFKNKTLKGLAVKAVTRTERDSAYAQRAAPWKNFSSGKKKEIMLGASRLALIQYGWKNLGCAGQDLPEAENHRQEIRFGQRLPAIPTGSCRSRCQPAALISDGPLF